MPGKVIHINNVYRASLLVVGVVIWSLMIRAGYAAYDENFGYAINAFMLSLSAALLVGLLWFKKRAFIRSNLAATALFFVTSSPLSIYLFVEFYNRFIGQFFAL